MRIEDIWHVLAGLYIILIFGITWLLVNRRSFDDPEVRWQRIALIIFLSVFLSLGILIIVLIPSPCCFLVLLMFVFIASFGALSGEASRRLERNND